MGCDDKCAEQAVAGSIAAAVAIAVIILYHVRNHLFAKAEAEKQQHQQEGQNNNATDGDGNLGVTCTEPIAESGGIVPVMQPGQAPPADDTAASEGPQAAPANDDGDASAATPEQPQGMSAPAAE